ncbi:MAG: hydantoinase/oxoprolinase family protein [Raoultibacter sp.]
MSKHKKDKGGALSEKQQAKLEKHRKKAKKQKRGLPAKNKRLAGAQKGDAFLGEAVRTWRLGIDVGGTNTDAVIIDGDLNLVASVKTPTTEDVMGGIQTAMHEVVSQVGADAARIGHAMLGTTHCTNAIVERKRLNKVAVVRVGAPATTAISCMADWPEDLKIAMHVRDFLVHGGNEFDGREIAPLDEAAIRQIAQTVQSEGFESVAIVAVFSPVSDAHEKRAAALMAEVLGGDFPLTLSSEIGSLGFLERENASILNAALVAVARTTTASFEAALHREGLSGVAVYLGQNDGTLMSVEYAKRYPIFTIACGPTNSIRGASFLAHEKEAVVVDIGGTTTDVGVLANGFPRESMVAVEIGDVRTNFRMPDLVSVGLGGGSIVRVADDGSVTVGPDSIGYRVSRDALCFGGSTLVATDIVVAKGLVENVGDPQLVAGLDPALVQAAYRRIVEIIEDAVDAMKSAAGDVLVVLVGGGSILAPDHLVGAKRVLRPENFGVANAIGSAISQISGQVSKVYSLAEIPRAEAIEDSKARAIAAAIKAGADPDTVEIIDVEDIPMAYLGDALCIRVKAVGSLRI